MDNYARVVQKIESLGVLPDRPSSLEPMKEALRVLDLKIDPKKTIVVAGTNGKGTVCATLEALFIQSGKKVGLYTSPHLVDTTERFRLCGKDISQKDFCQAFEAVQGLALKLRLSHFETLTLMAVWIFYSESQVEYGIFEVGLGGVWDATNAIPHDYCGITRLGLDHQNLLGNRIEEIAENKFGIVGPGAKVVHTPFPEGIQELARKVQQETQSQWVECQPYIYSVEKGPRFFLEVSAGRAEMGLPGKRAAENMALALTLFQELGFNSSLLALGQVRWRGRMEKVSISGIACPVYLSGDHNPDGAKSLVELLRHYSWEKLYFLVGIGKDKDHNSTLSHFFSLPKSFVFLTETPFRGRKIEDYGKWRKLAAGENPSWAQALRQVGSLVTEKDIVVVTGSLYLVGAVLGSGNRIFH